MPEEPVPLSRRDDLNVTRWVGHRHGASHLIISGRSDQFGGHLSQRVARSAVLGAAGAQSRSP
jgi:hypothetical protein